MSSERLNYTSYRFLRSNTGVKLHILFIVIININPGKKKRSKSYFSDVRNVYYRLQIKKNKE